MKRKVCSMVIIIIASALAGWGGVTTAVLAWVFFVGDFSGEGAMSGFFISIGLLGLIPLAIGAVLFLQRKSLVGIIAGPGE
ncbi:MAG: hypothetical protein JW838_00580 [Spirochaetes bacterium]|nr:hypothetical protein [Spirochaetota bacterium]